MTRCEQAECVLEVAPNTYCFFAPSSPCNINRTLTVSMGIVMHSATATETHELKKSVQEGRGGIVVK